MSVWTSKYVDSLPDSSFAWIDSSGDRHLPYKDAQGNIDRSHAANALSRLSQVKNMPSDVVEKIKSKLQTALDKVKADAGDERLSFAATPLKLDSAGALPTRIMLMTTGNWPNSIKGNFSINIDDLKEIKDNFDKGLGFPTDDTSTGLAIDFRHEDFDKAGAWMKGLELEVDQADPTKGKLYASPVEWTEAGEKAIKSGEFKCISPSGFFGRRGDKLSSWSDHRDRTRKAHNVIDGAGLTNKPFLAQMTPIRADSNADEGTEDYITVSRKKETNMNLDSLRVKGKEQLDANELKFLGDHKTELSADELKKFGLEERFTLSADEERIVADIRAGNKKVVNADDTVVDKTRLDALESAIEDGRKEKAHAIVEEHVKRGAVKKDSAGNWEKRLLSASAEDRTQLEADLQAIPSNADLGKEQGSGAEPPTGQTAREQLSAIATTMVEEAEKNGKDLNYRDALKLAVRQNPDLTQQDFKETGSAAA